MKSNQPYKLLLALALIGYGILYLPASYDLFSCMILAAWIHPENLRHCLPASFCEFPHYFAPLVAPLFLITGLGILLNHRWTVFFSVFSAIIGFAAFPFGTVLACCIIYSFYDAYKQHLFFR